MTDRTPVLVGLTQILQREDDPHLAREPVELMTQAVRDALADAGVSELLQKVSALRVIKGIWGYKNPAAQVREALGLGLVETGLSVLGGNHVQMVLNQSAIDLQEGRHDVIVLAGAECGRTLGRAQKAELDVPWLEESDLGPAPDVVYGTDKWTRHDAEMALGIQRAVHYYSLFEIALRHARGESPDEHLQRISELWAQFNRVAQNNPSAWIRSPISAEEIRTASPRNRAITYPYTKFMNANMRVDMASALVLTTVGTAKALGISEERFVFPWSGTDAYDHYFVSERDDLHSSPAVRLAGSRALGLAQVDASDLDFVDLYSCFPSAVQVAAKELGLEDRSRLSVTGGLTFGGGPLNNYVMHSIARTAELLRETNSGKALVTANGGMLTKHSFGVYGREPSGRPFLHENLQEEVDALPKREVAASHDGAATIESYVVVFGGGPAKPTKSANAIYGKAAESGSEPTLAHLACRLDDGRRTWANLTDRDVLGALCEEEFCGRTVLLQDGSDAQVV
ncbi:MAG: acetyl-CoA acetyltransferase [Acidobacteriota bacterium]